MEALHPVRNSSRYDSKPSGALAAPAVLARRRGRQALAQRVISNGVNILSCCAQSR